jgi:hypothetical protein
LKIEYDQTTIARLKHAAEVARIVTGLAETLPGYIESVADCRRYVEFDCEFASLHPIAKAAARQHISPVLRAALQEITAFLNVLES